MTHKVFSLINYIGHKSKIIDTVLQHIPKAIDGTFWDMFSGSCVVGLSSGFQNVTFVDNNEHLQNLYRNLQSSDFLSTLEDLITSYGLTNTTRKPRAQYLKDPNIGTCTWQGKTVPNMHLDQLNKKGYNKLMGDYNNNSFNGLKKACAYMLLTIYGRNSNVSLKKDGSLTGGVGPLDFSPKTKKKYFEHLESMKGRNLKWITGSYSSVEPKKGDFVYLDPPYLASGFKYSGWGSEDEKSLLEWIDNLECDWALSNAFVSGDTNNNILYNWAQNHKIIKINKNYRKWAAKGKSTAKRKNKKNEEVLILK